MSECSLDLPIKSLTEIQNNLEKNKDDLMTTNDFRPQSSQNTRIYKKE